MLQILIDYRLYLLNFSGNRTKFDGEIGLKALLKFREDRCHEGCLRVRLFVWCVQEEEEEDE